MKLTKKLLLLAGILMPWQSVTSVSRADTLFVADSGNNTVLEFTENGVGSVFASNNISGPWGVALDVAGNVYASFPGLGKVEKFSAAGTDLGVFASGMNGPGGLAFDSAGNLFVSNHGDDSIWKFSSAGTFIGIFGSTTAPGFSGYGAYPVGLAFDTSSNLYVACVNYNYIEKFTPSGVRSIYASNSVGPYILSAPYGVAFDKAGNLYVANNTGANVTKFGSGGSVPSFINTGYHSIGVAADSATNIYVTYGSPQGHIEKFSSSGVDLGPFATNNLINPFLMVFQPATTPATILTNIVVNPANLTINAGSNIQFTATEKFSDGSTQVVTNGGTNSLWSSSNPSVASINTNGMATGLTNGLTTITAKVGSISNSTSLTVAVPVLPSITVQPTNNTVSPNGSVTLSVSATGSGLTYQWRLNGTNISGATGATLTIPSVTSTNVGVYTVVVSNAGGSVTSQAAIVGTTDIKMFAGVIVNGPLGTNYLIQATSNLMSSWTTLTNVALPSQPYIYIDYSSPTNRQQFYRAFPQ